MKTLELTDRALDYAVALAEGALYQPGSVRAPFYIWPGNPTPRYSAGAPNYTTGPAGDHIIDREGISVVRCNDLYFPPSEGKDAYYEPYWKAQLWRLLPKAHPSYGDHRRQYTAYGTTRREAAMRAYAVSKLGDDIDIPKELL
jgi:hypothetical protein